MKPTFKAYLLISASLMASIAAPAFAQQAATDETDTSQPEEIIVTALRRSENAQKVSTAITALSGDSLAQSGVAVARDLDL